MEKDVRIHKEDKRMKIPKTFILETLIRLRMMRGLK